MKRKRLRMSGNLYTIIWSVILVISMYILIRFAALSFSDEVGQAKSIKDVLLSKLCISIIESSSSFISYNEHQEEGYSFAKSIVQSEFVLNEYVKDNSSDTILVKETSSNLSKHYQETDLNKSNNQNITDTQNISGTQSISDTQSIGYYDFTKGKLNKEYILTNGAMTYSEAGNSANQGNDNSGNAAHNLQVGYLEGDVYKTDDSTSIGEGSAVDTISNRSEKYTLEQLKNVRFLVDNFYIVDATTRAQDELFDAEKLLAKDMSMKQTNDKPQILIYHTHSQEAYVDSRPNNKEDSIVSLGTLLTEILREDYGYNVIHDTTTYDIVDGVLDRKKAYHQAEISLEKTLSENPSIEVIIDLHRDAGKARTTIVNGKEVAQVMLFQGTSLDQNGPMPGLDNPNLKGNLAFGLKLRLKSLELYPGFFFKTYLKCYRYNLHFREKSILVELGTDENTLQSATNSIDPLAKVLDEVLKGK